MKIYLGIVLLFLSLATAAQSPARMTISQIKGELEKTTNPILYAKQVLKKRFKLDTITVTQTKHFGGLADSLAYCAKLKKVYGPYGPKNGRFLVQVLSRAPNEFYHISQIFIDTAVFSYRFADSLGDVILKKLNSGSATFEDMASAYALGSQAGATGDMGWIARGAMFPVVEHEIVTHKKGVAFKLWNKAGLNIIRKDDEPRQDTGFALMMLVYL